MAAHFGRRLRRGAATTAVAAAAVAALSASQAPGVTGEGHHDQRATETTTPPDESSATGDSPYYTDLPPLNSPTAPPAAGDPQGHAASEAGIPATVLDAYKKAERSLAASQPGCHLPWQLLAAIGKVESGHARGGAVDADGTTLKPILGPVLNGNGFASIPDTDGGAFDGDTRYDRAVGPMQFIPSTWSQGGPDHQGWGADGNGDGRKDPNNVYDAALAAARYLCASGRDLSVSTHLNRAILSYNNSQDYLRTVLSWLEFYRKGTHEVPDGSGPLPSGTSPSPHPSPSSPSPSPSTPAEPTDPGKPTEPGDGTTPTPTDTVDAIEDAGTGSLTARTGDDFAGPLKVRAVDAKGKPVAGVRVRFTVTGTTDAHFEGGESVATVRTDATGTATAPALQAGTRPGDFTVRATLVGRTLPGLDYVASVAERRADALVRTEDKDLVCTPGAAFADTVEIRASLDGEAADGVAATATFITDDEQPAENDKGPYFKDADGKPIRTLDLTTDAEGLLKLPTLYADDATGTFLLRVTTAGGGQLTLTLTVAAADDTGAGDADAGPEPGETPAS